MTSMTAESDQSQATQDKDHNKDTHKDNINQEKKHITHSLIEQCVSLYRKRHSHQNVKDFDTKYIKDEFMENVLQGMTILPKIEPTSNQT